MLLRPNVGGGEKSPAAKGSTAGALARKLGTFSLERVCPRSRERAWFKIGREQSRDPTLEFGPPAACAGLRQGSGPRRERDVGWAGPRRRPETLRPGLAR